MSTFSEPELCVIRQWHEARLLERAMKDIRLKYSELLKYAFQKVQYKHKALSCTTLYLSRDGSESYFGIGKDQWPKDNWDCPSGFYVEDIQLENLTSSRTAAPYKNIWICGADSIETSSRLAGPAKDILGEDEFEKWKFFEPSSRGAGIWCWLEPKDNLLRLLTEGESSGFVDCLVAHYDQMAKFTTAINDILFRSKRGRRR